MRKQYIVIPKNIKMSPGKLASQAVHASFMGLEAHKEHIVKDYLSPFGGTMEQGDRRIKQWKVEGQCVIVCQAKDVTQLIGLNEYCKQWKIPCHLYVDEGHTEVACGQITAFATGIIEESDQWMFEKLELYNGK
jgi:peptidyl-tRNA hydrolase